MKKPMMEPGWVPSEQRTPEQWKEWNRYKARKTEEIKNKRSLEKKVIEQLKNKSTESNHNQLSLF